MDSRNPPELPKELIKYIGTFFGSKREDVQTYKNARLVCKEWAEQIQMPTRLHLYLLGAPVLVERSIDPTKLQWEAISAEAIQNSFNAIPQDGFLVFPTYTDAHLYAHKFYTGNAEPNYNNGIQGVRPIEITYLNMRAELLYHPVVFEVAYSCDPLLAIEWRPSIILNLDGKKGINVSAIRESNCKDNLEILSSTLAIEFVNSKRIGLATLHDSAAQARYQTGIPDEPIELLQEPSRCLVM